MKVISKLMVLLLVLSLSVFIYSQNEGENTQPIEANVTVQGYELSQQGMMLPASMPELSWCGTGPFGQVDVEVSGGASPFKWYRGSTLLTTSYSRELTLAFGCNGGLLTVKDANNNEAWGLVPQGCYDHGCE